MNLWGEEMSGIQILYSPIATTHTRNIVLNQDIRGFGQLLENLDTLGVLEG